MTIQKLPAAFSELEVFVDDWALDTQNARYAKRASVSAQALKMFYDAMLPRMEDILAEIDQFPLGEMPESHRSLYALALSMAEIAPNVELYRGSPLVPHSFEEARMGCDHGEHQTWQAKRPSE
jgi:hypothetical protein